MTVYQKLRMPEIAPMTEEAIVASIATMKEALFRTRIEVQVKGSTTNVKDIKILRKNIRRAHQTISFKKLEAAKEQCRELPPSKIPVRFRPKLTHRLRRQLTPEQLNKKLGKVMRREKARKLRNFALMA